MPSAEGQIRFHARELDRPDVQALLAAHLAGMHAQSPPESVHALPLEGLRRPDLTFFSARDADGQLLGVGALRELDASHGEIKSMRTVDDARNRGVGAAMLAHLLRVARERGYTRVSLETGTPEGFAPARRLYERHGFVRCAPFADYREDPFSCCMTLQLDGSAAD
ncbi:GNAT family N-acetyltransferase [Sphingomonas sp. PL-96]|uniref:GNAT family N-acetyltransferase n=1 Tax=Sphingomonas sp. PL-96 TaxID=2887201 RepID=UPI001E653EF2|nr:GNAT family N-acetyltransferase [Sphingomonas sp. PL-96]MCC2975101.1 GNAT family N-acetyltransferase [Sphingomonas sp. PL-96]